MDPLAVNEAKNSTLNEDEPEKTINEGAVLMSDESSEAPDVSFTLKTQAVLVYAIFIVGNHIKHNN